MTIKKDFRETWDSERWVIDRFVEAVESGEGDLRDRLAKRLLEGYTQHDWTRRRVNSSGIMVSTFALDPRHADLQDTLDALEAKDVNTNRLTKVAAGAPLTAREIEIWRSFVIERGFSPEFVYEHDEGNICVILEVKHSDRRRARLAVKNWDGQSGTLVAACSTYTEALGAIKRCGIVNMDDDLMWRERFSADSRFRE